MKKWNIGMVTYNSSPYIEYQLKILYQFNNSDDFDLIIVDNSKDKNEVDDIKKICNRYGEVYNNITIIENNPIEETASGQHGEGLDIVRKMADCQYLVVQDPDFFWLKNNYLSWLEHLLQYNDAVGIPYPRKVSEGQENFPGAFGCAYVFKKIKEISFKPYLNQDYEYSWKKYRESGLDQRGYDFFYDVGWLVRKHLSQVNDYNFISFHQVNIFNAISKLINSDISYSFETNTRLYLHNGEIVASHLFRGNFTGNVVDNKDVKNKIVSELWNLRKSISELMYNEILSNKEKFNNLLNCNFKLNDKIISSREKLVMFLFAFIYKIKKTKYIKFLVPVSAKFIKKKINLN